MTVNLPKKGAFAVYDELGNHPLIHSTVNGNNKLILPKSGTIVFVGAPGSEFTLTIK